jgi:hypothetical protein
MLRQAGNALARLRVDLPVYARPYYHIAPEYSTWSLFNPWGRRPLRSTPQASKERDTAKAGGEAGTVNEEQAAAAPEAEAGAEGAEQMDVEDLQVSLSSRWADLDLHNAFLRCWGPSLSTGTVQQDQTGPKHAPLNHSVLHVLLRSTSVGSSLAWRHLQ